MPKKKNSTSKQDVKEQITKPTVAPEAPVPDPHLNVSIRPLLAYLERAQRRGEMDKVLKGLHQLVSERGDVQLGIQASDWLALLSVFAGLAICSSTTYTVTGSVTPAAAGASTGASISGGTLTIAFNVAGGTANCSITPIAATIVNVSRGGAAIAAGPLAIGLMGFYTTTAPAPALWTSGDQLDITITLATSNKTWCDTCLLTAATATYTVFIM